MKVSIFISPKRNIPEVRPFKTFIKTEKMFKKLLLIAGVVLFLNLQGFSQKTQFLYKLKVVPRLIKPEAWTDVDNKIVEVHFKRLVNLMENGILITAGRTLNEDESSFGIVVIEVENEKEARQLMNDDPAVKDGIMTAELFPYRTALIRKE